MANIENPNLTPLEGLLQLFFRQRATQSAPLGIPWDALILVAVVVAVEVVVVVAVAVVVVVAVAVVVVVVVALSSSKKLPPIFEEDPTTVTVI